MKFSLSSIFLKSSSKTNESKKNELINIVVKDLVENGIPNGDDAFSERISQFVNQEEFDLIEDDLPEAFRIANAEDIIKYGPRVTELAYIGGAIILLYLDGVIYEDEDSYNQLHKEMKNGCFNKNTLSKLHNLTSYYISESDLNNLKDVSGSQLNDILPYYLLQKKHDKETPQKIECAKEWVSNHSDEYLYQIGLGCESGYYRCSAWLKQETPPFETPEWKEKIQKTQRKYIEDRKQKNKEAGYPNSSPIYGGRPREILIKPKRSLSDDFLWWSLQLSLLLNPKNRATEFIGNIEYDEVGFELGKRCVELLPTASKNRLNDDDKYSFQENNGLVRYISLLIDYEKFEEALFVCEECIKYGVHDGTKTGFSGRAKKIKNKISKLTPKSKATAKRGRKGKLSDEQILEVVTLYLSSSSEERKELSQKYDITRSNLSYLVSKNRHRIEL